MLERCYALAPAASTGGGHGAPAAPGAGGRDGIDGSRALRLYQRPGGHWLQLGIYVDHHRAVTATVETLLGVSLPTRTEVVPMMHGRCYRVASDQYWVQTPDSTLAARLLAAVDPALGSVTSLSHGRVRVGVRGAAVRDMLATLVPIDLRPGLFPVGEHRQTVLHHTAVVLEHCGVDDYELLLLRSYAQSCWECLVDAALPFGYDIEVEQS